MQVGYISAWGSLGAGLQLSPAGSSQAVTLEVGRAGQQDGSPATGIMLGSYKWGPCTAGFSQQLM